MPRQFCLQIDCSGGLFLLIGNLQRGRDSIEQQIFTAGRIEGRITAVFRLDAVGTVPGGEENVPERPDTLMGYCVRSLIISFTHQNLRLLIAAAELDRLIRIILICFFSVIIGQAEDHLTGITDGKGDGTGRFAVIRFLTVYFFCLPAQHRVIKCPDRFRFVSVSDFKRCIDLVKEFFNGRGSKIISIARIFRLNALTAAITNFEIRYGKDLFFTVGTSISTT